MRSNPDKSYTPPLVVATTNNQPNTLKVLLSLDLVEVNDTSHSGKSALYVASEHGHTTCAQLLIAHGAQIGVVTSHCRNALHAAVEHNHVSTFELLCKHATVNDITL